MIVMGSRDFKSNFRAEKEGDLFSTQRSALRIILGGCIKIIARVIGQKRKYATDPSDHTQPVINPHEVFCIDGGRGAGKTYTLTSLQHVLGVVSKNKLERNPARADWEDLFNSIDEDDRAKINAQEEPLVDLLRIIFPGDMEGGEFVMEAILSALGDKLHKLEKIGKSAGGISQHEKTVLEKQLRRVAEGFYFARRFGVDAIIRDSTDYEDLVQNFEKHSKTALDRIYLWRDFIDDYLETRNVQVLIIFLDDSDVEVDLTRDLLHALRMFLCHPRIITILAGNIRAMRDSLIHQGMHHIGSSMAALDRGNPRTAADWRRMVRKHAEYYLEKVIPQERRFFIGPPTLGKSGESKGETDFAKVVGDSFRGTIDRRVRATREQFLKTKYQLAIIYELDRSDAPVRDERKSIENFLSWWMFGNRYAGPLAPRSARQINTFRRYYVPDRNDRADKSSHTGGHVKRLPVMLHDNPENYTLIQRLGDEDESVIGWLWQQELTSVWVGQRSIRINGRSVHQGTYTYDYISYRLDVNLAMPLRDNADEAVPLGLLPRLRGRRYMRRFYQPHKMQKQQRRVGISRWLDHAAVPGNCAYFCDLGALPDMSFIRHASTGRGGIDDRRTRDELDDEHNSGKWEAKLAGRWVEFLEEEQDEKLVRYFTEVTCDRLSWAEKVPSTRLINTLSTSEEGIGHLENSYDEYVRDEIRSFSERPRNVLFTAQTWVEPKRAPSGQPGRSGKRDRRASAKIGADDANIFKAQRMIARQAALISDLRRAWHAIRIHAVAPAWLESGDSTGATQETERTSLAIIANQSRMPLYSRVGIEKLLNRTPWTKYVRNAFRLDAVEGALREAGLTSMQKDIKDRLAAVGYLYKLGDVPGEETDFERWIDILRAVGRSTCEGWPITDDPKIDYQAVNLRRKGGPLEHLILSEAEWRLNISSPAPEIMSDEAKAERQKLQKPGREARNLVWLLYGLAPSLSAILHTQIMAEIYHVESFRADRRELRESVKAELKAWAELIGTLSVVVRYIKVKCLHLYAKLFLEHLLSIDDAQRGPADARLDSQREFLASCGIFANTSDARVRIITFLHQGVFGKDTSTDLAIMPDVAPSTLLGEKWMTDLVDTEGVMARLKTEFAGVRSIRIEKRNRTKNDNPMEVRGILSETEQWLWATSRCIRKLWLEVDRYTSDRSRSRTHAS